MADNICKMCSECEISFTDTCHRYHCRSCGRVLCRNCVWGYGSLGIVASGNMKSTGEAGIDIKACKFCSLGRYSDKIYPSESPRQSPEPASPSFSSERYDGYSPHAVTKSCTTSFTGHPSPVSIRFSPSSRSDEEEDDDSGKNFFSPLSEYYHDTSDIDSSSVSARHEFYSFKSVGSSPSDSPSRIHITSNRVGRSVQQEQGGTPRSQNDATFDQEIMAVLRRPESGTEDPENTDDCTDDLSIFRDQCDKLQKPLDFENNGLIWFPPPPEDEDDEAENNFFSYDDEDDDIGESGAMFSSSSSLSSIFPAKEKQNEGHKEPLRAVVQGHFRALVSQLLQGEGIKVGKENNTEDWLDIVTSIAWQAANFVKPDTSQGGSMDPGDYVKIKCVASGNPSESILIKGVVCTKNIKHKRMTSQYRNPRLLLLGGALEYLRVPNQLASFDTLLQQEIDHLKMIVSKIESLRPNVLLVEKSVSSYAQEYLLAKEISLVLNVQKAIIGAYSQFNRRPSKTLMFFEGCPRRLGCTVLLKGSCREELKKVKHVVQYAVFAAYHLSLETSFLADEGASLPKMKVKPSITVPERTTADNAISVICNSVSPSNDQVAGDITDSSEGLTGRSFKLGEQELLSDRPNSDHNSSPASMNFGVGNLISDAYNDNLVSNVALEDLRGPTVLPSGIRNHAQQELLENTGQERRQPGEIYEKTHSERIDENEASSEYYSATDSHQSILVSFSSRCVLNGTVCERSRLLRIKFYGCFDKPLGRYLRDDLFNPASCCRSCTEPAEAHVLCYTHQQGNLTINVRRLPSVKLPGERDGKIWMWHRCLRCAHIDGVPPATRRVVMSDAAWGLSFGKFLELSFSNHATANRIASCGHSLQRDCLRYYGFGSMVAFFRYSPIDILCVRLPPLVIEFNGHVQQDWIRKEAAELLTKMEALYAEILGVLNSIEQKCPSFGHEPSDTWELKDLLIKERNYYNELLQPTSEEASQLGHTTVDILELNRLRHSLLIGSHFWDRRLYSLDYLLKTRSPSTKATQDAASNAELKESKSDLFLKDGSFDSGHEENVSNCSKLQEFPRNDIQLEQKEKRTFPPAESGASEDSISVSVPAFQAGQNPLG
ncbi:hypothetical protein F0562_033445 [Nyssa sinensis]|uniref:FYVE-type domain-containing protein n=1 Tax=Nyssa sinensis TaxID=561372 RepID=A0A5J5AHZ8_9ASTE|nr:hypothetical protein F0562_033445 [Nyssa sinensis]